MKTLSKVKRDTNSKPRGAIRNKRNEGDSIWKKSLSGETTRTCTNDLKQQSLFNAKHNQVTGKYKIH